MNKSILTYCDIAASDQRVAPQEYFLATLRAHAYLHNATIADAILDRIIHNAYKIELEGESQRKEMANKAKK